MGNNEIYVATCVANELGTVCQKDDWVVTTEGFFLGLIFGALLCSAIALAVLPTFFYKKGLE